MGDYRQILYPPEYVVPGLESNIYTMNGAANRVIETATGKFVSALVPGSGVSDQLSRLPLDPAAASRAVQATQELQRFGPLLQSMQLVGTIGALASVATLGVCCVGFSVVLKRLSRLEAKLDESLAKLDLLRQAVDELQIHNDVLRVARLRSAGDCLDRALAADSAGRRNELASTSRDLFQEARTYHLELWRRATPWSRLQVPVAAASEMRGRFEAAALGEIQAEFIRGDLGAFRHAVKTIAADYETHYVFNPAATLRARSDEACVMPTQRLGQLWTTMPQLSAELKVAGQTGTWTLVRLRAFEEDAELPGLLGLEPHEVAAAIRSVPANEIGILAAA